MTEASSPGLVAEPHFSVLNPEQEYSLAISSSLSVEDIDHVLAHAVRLKASDITFQPGQPIWAEIAGRWIRLTKRSLRLPEVEVLARAIYGDNAMALLNAGRDADPSYEIRHPAGEGRLRFRVNLTAGRLPGGLGAQITLRALPSQPIPVSALGVEPAILEHFRPAQGLNLVCGPTGSGKSTLLSSLVRWRCEQKGANEKVIEYSKPIEYVFDGLEFPDSFVWQTEVGTHLRNSEDDGEASLWSYCVRNALRRKPSIILVGEARDRPTIQASIEAALTGHLVLTTLHTIGVPETIRRLLIPFAREERDTVAVDLLQVLNMVVTQILVRDRHGGRVAIREYLVFDQTIRRKLEALSSDRWPALLRDMIDSGQSEAQSMLEAATALLRAGRIDEQVHGYVTARQAVAA